MKAKALLLALAATLLTGCGGTPEGGGSQGSGESGGGEVETKTVSSIAVTTNPNKLTYTEGDSFDPTGMVVEATYSDGSKENVTNYSVPNQALTVSTTSITISLGGKTTSVQITVNPKATPKEIFVRAKNKTYENNVYEYTYSAQAKIKFKDALEWSPAKLSGTIQYDASAAYTQYMHKKEVTGALVFDYTTYTYNQGLSMITVNANEKKDFSIVNKETLPNNYEFETNSIGYILKALEDNDNLKVTKSGDQYNLDLKTSFAQDSLLKVLNYVDSRKIVDTLSDYTTDKWGVGFTYNCYAKLNAAETSVSTFHFDASVSIKDTVEIGFEFEQNFTKVGSGVKISLPEFENTFTTTEKIGGELATINSALNAAKKNYYDYKLKTGVDHGVSKTNILGLAVNSTSAGYARREIVGNEVYFHNRLEVDSDYKNKDQLGDLVKDYERYRAKLNNTNKDVYDVEDGILKNTYTLMENYNNDAIDDYYMMINSAWLTTDAVKILRKTTNSKNVTTYKLGIGSDTIKEILEYYNKSIRIDPTGVTPVKVYNIVNSFEAKKAEFEIVLDADGKMTDINVDLKGFYVCETSKQVKFTYNLDIEFDNAHKAYEAPSEKEDIKLSASV